VSYIDTAVLQNVTYQYRVKAIHLVNGDSGYAIGTPVSLLTPPSAPSNLNATLATTLPVPRVTLNWTDNATNELGFNLARQTGTTCAGATWTALPAQLANTVSFIDTGVAANTGYCYRIQSFNAAGQSAWVTSTVTVPAVPGTGPAPTVNGATTTTLNVNFTVPATALGYEIRSATGATSTTYTTIASSAGTGAVSFTNAGLSSSTTYRYSVRVYNAGGFGAWSADVNGTTLAAPPAAPAVPTVATLTATSLTLNWGTVTGATSYTVQRATDAAFTANVVTTTSTTASLNVTGLTGNTTYYFHVSASNAGGPSAYSGTKTQLTLPNAPTGVIAVNGAVGLPKTGGLTWTVPAGGATSYNVRYAATLLFLAPTVVPNVPSGQQISINVTAASGTRYMQVQAVNASGVSAWAPATPIAVTVQ
jgi:titin